MFTKDKIETIHPPVATDTSRRTLALGLLGAIGGLSFANGCTPSSENGPLAGPESDDISSVAQTLTGLSALAWVDTILALPLTSAVRTKGDLATNTSSSLKAEIVIAKGSVAAGDGGGGIFYWSTSGTDDGGTVIVPNKKIGDSGITGCWQRLYSGSVNVRWFGATGDGTTDDSESIRTALSAVNAMGGGSVFFPAGTYCARDIEIYSNTTIYGEGEASVLLIDSTGLGVSTLPIPTTGRKHDIVLRDLKFLGTTETKGFSEHLHLIYLVAIYNILVEHCSFVGFRGDGIYIGATDKGSADQHNENITIRSCKFDGVNKKNRQGISIVDGTNVLIEDNSFFRCTMGSEDGGPPMPGAIDIEPNYLSKSHIINIKIINNTFTDIGGSGGVIGMFLPGAQEDFGADYPMNGLVIQGNHITNFSNSYGISIVQLQKAGASSYPNNILIKDNLIDGGPSWGISMSGIRSAEILNNKILNTAGPPVCFGVTAKDGTGLSVYEITLADNFIYHCDTRSGDHGVLIRWADRVKICRNIIDSLGKPDGSYGYALDLGSNSTSSYIAIEDNVFIAGGRTRYAIVRERTHTLTASTNQYRNNDLGGLSLMTSDNRFQYTSPGSVLEATVTLDAPKLGDKTYTSSDISVEGADVGDYVHVACSENLRGAQLSGYVSAKGVVNFTLTNNTGAVIDLPNAVYYVKVTKK